MYTTHWTFVIDAIGVIALLIALFGLYYTDKTFRSFKSEKVFEYLDELLKLKSDLLDLKINLEGFLEKIDLAINGLTKGKQFEKTFEINTLSFEKIQSLIDELENTYQLYSTGYTSRNINEVYKLKHTVSKSLDIYNTTKKLFRLDVAEHNRVINIITSGNQRFLFYLEE